MAMFYGYDRDTLSLRGGTMIDMDNNTILNIKNLTFSNTLDSISINNKQLKQLAAPTDSQDAVSKGYTEANFLQLSGGTMAGNIAMDNNIISNIKNLTFSDTFDRIDLNGKQLKQLGNPIDPQDAVSKVYTEANFLQLSGGAMAGPLTLHSHPTEKFHPCTKEFTEILVRRGKRRELVYMEWKYKNISKSGFTYPKSSTPIIVGNTLTESSDAAFNILTTTFTASFDMKHSIELSFNLNYVTKNGVREFINLGIVVLTDWHYSDVLTYQINKEYNLHKTLTKTIATSIRSFYIGIKQGPGRAGSALPSSKCSLIVSLSDMV